MKKRIYTAAGLFLAAALVLGGCGKEKVPESEFATADEAKEALTSAETIEIYFDLYGSKRKTKIVAVRRYAFARGSSDPEPRLRGDRNSDFLLMQRPQHCGHRQYCRIKSVPS